MDTITSRQNKIVREAASLLSSAEERRQRGQFLCEGARLCEDAARSGVEILRCFFTAQAQQKYARYLEPVLAAAGESYLVADHVAPLLSSTKHPQGVFCQCRWPQGLLVGGPVGEASCAVLEDLQDPGNLGTILRRRRLWESPRCTCWESAATPFPPKRCGRPWGRRSGWGCGWSPPGRSCVPSWKPRGSCCLPLCRTAPPCR